MTRSPALMGSPLGLIEIRATLMARGAGLTSSRARLTSMGGTLTKRWGGLSTTPSGLARSRGALMKTPTGLMSISRTLMSSSPGLRNRPCATGSAQPVLLRALVAPTKTRSPRSAWEARRRGSFELRTISSARRLRPAPSLLVRHAVRHDDAGCSSCNATRGANRECAARDLHR